MTTLAALKARIADDLLRTDLTSQIADAITDAITYYQSERFYFNETRDTTFSTVAGQQIYDGSDAANIPLFVTIDAIFITVSGRIRELRRRDPAEIEILSDNGAERGEPYCYAYFNESLRLYPIPADAYTVRIQGHIRLPAPASDDETGNKWMTEAFELLRCHAKGLIALHVDPEQSGRLLLSMMGPDGQSGAVGMALRRLRGETSKRIGSGRLVPTSW